MFEQILDQFEQLLQQEIADFGVDFARDEQVLWETILAFGHAALQRIVDRQPNGYRGSCIPCNCGGWMKFVQHRSRDIHTLFGWIKLSRAYYRCPDCGNTCTPYDQTSGLGSQQLSPALAKACCMLAVDGSFQEVCRRIENLFGQHVCDDTIEQVVHHVGGAVLQRQVENPALDGMMGLSVFCRTGRFLVLRPSRRIYCI